MSGTDEELGISTKTEGIFLKEETHTPPFSSFQANVVEALMPSTIGWPTTRENSNQHITEQPSKKPRKDVELEALNPGAAIVFCYHLKESIPVSLFPYEWFSLNLNQYLVIRRQDLLSSRLVSDHTL